MSFDHWVLLLGSIGVCAALYLLIRSVTPTVEYDINKDRPLEYDVSRGLVTITIGIKTLAECAEQAPFAQEFDSNSYDAERFKVVDLQAFADDVVYELAEREDEDGSTLLSHVIDVSFLAVAEKGGDGFVWPATGHR